MADDIRDADISMDTSDLYREESFTDRKIGTIQRLQPVTADGQPDSSRADVYIGQTQILTPAGALPLSFEIEAKSFADAVAGFGDAAKQALAGTMQRLEEMRRDAASSIIVPGGGAAPGGGMPGAGAPPGGGLKIP